MHGAFTLANDISLSCACTENGSVRLYVQSGGPDSSCTVPGREWT